VLPEGHQSLVLRFIHRRVLQLLAHLFSPALSSSGSGSTGVTVDFSAGF
jgi:hypothetical protein